MNEFNKIAIQPQFYMSVDDVASGLTRVQHNRFLRTIYM